MSKHRKWLLLLFSVLLPLYGFGWLAEAVWNRGGLDWDTPALLFLHKYDSPRLDKLLLFVAQSGDMMMVLFFTVVCAVLLLLWKRQRDERFLAHCVIGAAAIIFAVKAMFSRIRLHFWESLPPQIDLGSPSAHSMGTLALALGVVVIAWRTRWRWSAIVFFALYAVSVALSRVYLGAHQASDILAAWALSLAWVGGLSVFRGAPVADLAWEKKCTMLVSGLLAGLVTILVGYISSDLKHANLRVVVPREVYRSGQMNADQLAHAVERYRVKSVLNLRGENLAAGWYQAETATAARLNVVHYDHRLSAEQELSLEQMDELMGLLSEIPKPVLIHCRAGADRAGLVSALYLFALEGRSPSEAGAELSVWRGHVPFLYPKVAAMDASFRRYVGNRTAHKRLSLRPEPISP